MLKPTKRQRQIRKLHDAQERRFIRRFGEARFICLIGVVAVMTTLDGEDDHVLAVVPALAIIAYAMYKKYHPTESLYDDPERVQSDSPKTDLLPNAPSAELKATLGPVADDLHEIEKRLLDNMATSRVAGPGYIDAMRTFLSTRSGLIERVKSARKNSKRRTRRRREPRSD